MRKRWRKLVAIGLTMGLLFSSVVQVSAEESGGETGISQETVKSEGLEGEEKTPETEPETDPEKTPEKEPEKEPEKTPEKTPEAVLQKAPVKAAETVPQAAPAMAADVGAEDGSTDEGTTEDDAEPLTGAWVQDSRGWWYAFSDGGYAEDGIYEIDGVLYAFDKAGWMVTGWYKDVGEMDGKPWTIWYYFDKSGAMETGWIWDGAWYYLDETGGNMYHSGVYTVGTGVNYAFDSSGAMITGWYEYTYKDENGETYTDWFYFDPSGAMHKGWLWDGAWYYLDEESGYMYSGGEEYITPADNYCYFDASGRMLTGWVWNTEDKLWNYYDASGYAHTGWLLYKGSWYYCNNGEMYYHNIYSINGRAYGFDKSGVMQTGWFKYVWGDANTDFDWFYFEPSGAGHNGWLSYGGAWYWIADGWMNTLEYYNCSTEEGKVEWSQFRPDGSGIWIDYAPNYMPPA